MALRDVLVDVTPLRRSRDFRLLWTGLTVSAVGSRMTDVAIPFLVYRLTHSSLAVGLLGLCALVPRLGLSLLAGSIADAVDRRRLLLVAEVGGLAATVVLLVNAQLDHPQLWLLYVCAVVVTSFYALASPAHRSIVPSLVEPEELAGAYSVVSTSYSTSWLLGPTIGGILLGTGGPSAAFVADLVSFVIALWTLARMRPFPPAEGADQPGLRSMVDGLRFLRRQPVVLGCFLVDLNAMVFGMPMALFPAVVDQRYSSSAIGLLYAAPFLGSFVVSVTSGWTNRIYRHGLAVCWCVAGWGGAIVAFGFVRPLWAAVAMLAIAGGFDMVSGVFRQSIVALATPEGMRGRVEGAGMAVWTTGPALGDLEAGTVARLTSVDVSIVSGGVLCVAGVAVLALSLPTFLRYDRRSLGTASQSTAAPTP